MPEKRTSPRRKMVLPVNVTIDSVFYLALGITRPGHGLAPSERIATRNDHKNLNF